MLSSKPNYVKLRTNLRLCINRLKLLEKKKTEMALKARREIADYIAAGKEDRARIRVEHIIREDYLVEAMEIVELLCDLLLARFGLIEKMAELDPGIEEAIATIIWVTPRLSGDIQELRDVSNQLTIKYGKEYALMCLRNGFQNVNEKVLHRMNIAAPPKLLVENYMIEIAKTYNIPFEPDPLIMMGAPPDAASLIDFGNGCFSLDENTSVGSGGGGRGGGSGGGGGCSAAATGPSSTGNFSKDKTSASLGRRSFEIESGKNGHGEKRLSLGGATHNGGTSGISPAGASLQLSPKAFSGGLAGVPYTNPQFAGGNVVASTGSSSRPPPPLPSNPPNFFQAQLPQYDDVMRSPTQYHTVPGSNQPFLPSDLQTPSSGATESTLNQPSLRGQDNLLILPDVPGLPSVPTNSIGVNSAGGEDVDFDDLTRRFEELKRKK